MAWARLAVMAIAAVVAACAQQATRAPEAPPVVPPAPAPPPAPIPPAPAPSAPPPVNLSGFPAEYRRGHGDGCAAARAGSPASGRRSGQYAIGWSDGYRYCSRLRR